MQSLSRRVAAAREAFPLRGRQVMRRKVLPRVYVDAYRESAGYSLQPLPELFPETLSRSARYLLAHIYTQDIRLPLDASFYELISGKVRRFSSRRFRELVKELRQKGVVVGERMSLHYIREWEVAWEHEASIRT